VLSHKETTSKGIRVTDPQACKCIFPGQRTDNFWSAHVCYTARHLICPFINPSLCIRNVAIQAVRLFVLTYQFLRPYRPKQPTDFLFLGLSVLLQLFRKSAWTRITQTREDGRRTTCIHTSSGIQAHGPRFIGRKQDTSYDTATMAMQVESSRSKQTSSHLLTALSSKSQQKYVF
jgi:hypothetical protein